MFSEVANGVACLKRAVMPQKLKQRLRKQEPEGSFLGMWLMKDRGEQSQIHHGNRKERWESAYRRQRRRTYWAKKRNGHRETDLPIMLGLV